MNEEGNRLAPSLFPEMVNVSYKRYRGCEKFEDRKIGGSCGRLSRRPAPLSIDSSCTFTISGSRLGASLGREQMKHIMDVWFEISCNLRMREGAECGGSSWLRMRG